MENFNQDERQALGIALRSLIGSFNNRDLDNMFIMILADLETRRLVRAHKFLEDLEYELYIDSQYSDQYRRQYMISQLYRILREYDL